MQKRTLGGKKKYSFEPKIPLDNDLSDVEIIECDAQNLEHIETIMEHFPKAEKPKDRQNKRKPRERQQSITTLSALDIEGKVSDKAYISNQDIRKDVNFSDVNEPQLIKEAKRDTMLFEDDFIYMFQLPNGFERGKMVVYDDKSCGLVIDDSKYIFRSRELNNQVVVKIDKEVEEVGNIYSVFVACKEVN
ncbi:hypothetical protein TCON_0859 [Astathelohania contejeani]|uniref:Uncharacterized protein n=1 Tax=Astathelohania contejeani TaxID=164912 RepID=A0ABQ7I0D6_9MICR|nr:hypothetical protein TCON_0859 [Thelohania contejeani]